MNLRGFEGMNRKVNIIEDLNGKKVVLINDVFFRGKKNIDWDMVEQFYRMNTHIHNIHAF